MIITEQELSAKLYSLKPAKDLLLSDKKDSLLTGISYIDNDFGFPCGYYVILGNPGTGKSWFALWLARMFYRHNDQLSVYFSLEMPEPMVRRRILQQWSDITKIQLETGASTGPSLELMGKDVIVIDEFYADNTAKQTPENFVLWVGEYYKLGYRLFHFDHLHELAGANDNNQNQRVTELWAKTFQQLCKDLPDIWLFIYAQPNGAAASKKIIRRTDIAGSKAITQKCDYVLSLNRNVDVDQDTGMVVQEQNTRNIFVWIDKTRYTEKAYIGFKIHFSETGNFFALTGERNV